MVSLKHGFTATGTNNPNKQVSVDRWNAEHNLTGTADTVLAFDANGNAVEATASERRASLGLTAGGGAALVGSTEGTVQADLNIRAVEVGLFSGLGSVTVPAAADRIVTSGRTTIGQFPAVYIRDSEQTALRSALQTLADAAADVPTATTQLTTLQGRVRAQDARGVWWIIDETAQEIHAGHWGAVPDGAYTAATGAMTGTDAQPAIQAMIDWQAYIYRRTARDKNIASIPAGIFRLATPLRSGYGQYHTIIIQGADRNYAHDQCGGTTLLADFDTHPAICLTSAQWGGVENLAIIGKSRHYIINNSFANNATLTSPDDITLANWHDSTNNPLTDPTLRYKPYAGVAIDPFNGTAPAAPYPELTIPAWVDAAHRTGTIYGAWGGSTVPKIKNVRIDGFAVGVVNQPSDYDGNGDFLKIADSHIAYCAVGLSVGNTQSRNVDVRNSNFGRVHTIVATALHGKQNGRLQGIFDNCSSSECIQLHALDNGSSIWGPLTFNHFYSENMWVLGSLQHGGASATGVTYNGCSFGFNLQGSGAAGERGIPRAMLWNPSAKGQESSGGKGLAKFNNCSFGSYETVLTLLQIGVSLEGTQVRPNVMDDYSATPSSIPLWKRSALNALAGGLVVPRLRIRNAGPMSIVHDAMHQHTLATGALQVRSEAGVMWTNRNYPASIYCPTLTPSSGRAQQQFPNMTREYEWDKAAFTVNTFTANTGVWAFTVNTTEAYANMLGMCPGAVIVDADGFVFFVETRGGAAGAYTITANLMNGYRVDSGGATRSYPEGSFTAASGSCYSYAGRFFTPNYPTIFDTTAASVTLSNVTRGDGGSQTADFAVGDWVYVDEYIDYWNTGVTRIAAITSPNMDIVTAPGASSTDRKLELAQCAQP